MKKTLLQQLKHTTELNTRELSKRLDVKESTLSMQLLQPETVKPTIKYMRILGIKEITGIENNSQVTIQIK